jgi:hypothetical protein
LRFVLVLGHVFRSGLSANPNCGKVHFQLRQDKNRGRHLEHEFTVLNLMQMGMVTSNGMAKGRFILDTFRYNSERNLAISVWVTRAGQLEPLQAAGGWLVTVADAGK